MDLRIDKSVHLGRSIYLMFYMRILNLFNSKNVENVYPYSGTAETDGMINDPHRTATMMEVYGEKGREIYHAINTHNGQSYWDYTGNQLYGHPRQIIFGLTLSY